MEHKLTIWGRLPSINQYNTAQRTNRFAGAQMKRNAQDIINLRIKDDLLYVFIDKPVFIKYAFYEPNKKRDHDNVSAFAHKVIQDALVECGVIKDDGWDEVIGFQDLFYLDRKEPRIEVTIVEVEDGQR